MQAKIVREAATGGHYCYRWVILDDRGSELAGSPRRYGSEQEAYATLGRYVVKMGFGQ